ncbi:uncharacterized protein [Montipora capricornis]|uniref:uncharacterized protein n=1 Tax=Montipora capricornis TaxID=246305 RepID=UPI0035F1F3BB
MKDFTGSCDGEKSLRKFLHNSPLRSYRRVFSAHCNVGPIWGSSFAAKFPRSFLHVEIMGGGDYCAVFNCNNDRRFKEKAVVMDHVKELKWHICPPKWRKLWMKLINREDLTRITNNSKKEHQYAKSAESRESVSDDCTCRKLCENCKHRLWKLQDENQELQSKVLSTWLPLLASELKPLLHWPKQEELPLYYPDCFKKYNNVRAIIDCTEVPIQRPSLARANSQIYSSYKGRPTPKVLVACTPAGTISFVSKAVGGSMSDKELVKRSGIVDLFSPGDTLLADRGFNIQELLLHKGVKLVIPPFLKAKKQFLKADDQRTKQVANARIHVERVTGRMKDFHIMKTELPLDMFDRIVTVTAALVNLQIQTNDTNDKIY